MAANVESSAPRVCYVDTSNEPRTDEEAVSMITKALARAGVSAGDAADLHFNLGNAQGRRGFGDRAEAAFRSCLACDPARSDAANNLALRLMKRGAFDDAAAELARALARGPPNAGDLETNLGVALEHVLPPDLGGAAAAYARAIAASDSSDARPLANLAALENRNGAAGSAIRLAEAAVAAAPEDPYVRFGLAAILDDCGRTERAIAAYEATLALRSEAADAHNNLAALLEAEGRDPERIERHYAAARAHGPKDADYACNHGAYLASRGRGEAAAAAFEDALALDRGRADAHLGLAEIHATAGRIAPALESAKRAAASAAHDDEAAAARELYRNLLVIWRDTRDDADVLGDMLESRAGLGS